MACVDIISQLVPVVDDPFANWIKFEDDVDNVTFNKSIQNDPFDIFSIFNSHENTEKHIDEKHIEVKQDNDNNAPCLLDLTKIPSNISSLFSDKKNSKSKVCQLYHQTNKSNQLSLNIVGLNINTHQTLQIKNEQYTFSNIPTKLTAHNTVKDLKTFIRQTCKINPNIEILMIYSHSVLLNQHNTLKSYGICNNSCIFIAICEDTFKFNSFLLNNDNSANDFSKLFNMLSNDYLQFEQLQSKILNEIHRYQMQGFKCKRITDLDILTYEKVTNCIEMPCGHGMTIDGLYSYVQSELNSKKMFIKCPHVHYYDYNQKCNQIWYFPIIRYILMESKQVKINDIIKLELLSSVNTFDKYYHHSKCPNCKHNLYRHLCDDKNRALSHCPLCVNTFCWKCCELWNDKTSQIYCGNKNCHNFEREVYQILSECQLKTIGRVSDVPSIRLCPKCSQLINHTEACKHMDCHSCKLNFCFVCLKPMVNDEWQCGGSSDRCEIAPIQTEGNINREKFEDNNLFLEMFEEIEIANVAQEQEDQNDIL